MMAASLLNRGVLLLLCATLVTSKPAKRQTNYNIQEILDQNQQNPDQDAKEPERQRPDESEQEILAEGVPKEKETAKQNYGTKDQAKEPEKKRPDESEQEILAAGVPKDKEPEQQNYGTKDQAKEPEKKRPDEFEQDILAAGVPKDKEPEQKNYGTKDQVKEPEKKRPDESEQEILAAGVPKDKEPEQQNYGTKDQVKKPEKKRPDESEQEILAEGVPKKATKDQVKKPEKERSDESEQEILAEGAPKDDEAAHKPGDPFSFSYNVKDEKGNEHSRTEESDGEIVKGEYRVLLPDGRTQVVKYTADWKNGYRPKISYIPAPAKKPDEDEQEVLPGGCAKGMVKGKKTGKCVKPDDEDEEDIQAGGFTTTAKPTTPTPPSNLYGTPDTPKEVRDNPKFGYSDYMASKRSASAQAPKYIDHKEFKKRACIPDE